MAKSFSLESLVNTGDNEKNPDQKPEEQGNPKPSPKQKMPARKTEPASALAGPSKRLSLTLDAETYRALRLHAVEADRTHQDILEEAARTYLRKHAGA